MKPNIGERAALIKSMHHVIQTLNDERGYEVWIMCVPDEPDDEDFEWVAENDFEHVQELFTKLVKTYGKDGWFVDF